VRAQTRFALRVYLFRSNRRNAVRFSIRDARALGEAALARVGYGEDDARCVAEPSRSRSDARLRRIGGRRNHHARVVGWAAVTHRDTS
jgi:hypothetical protein